jgi:curved DNA-binding protein CbpA
MKNLYQILGVLDTAEDIVIRAAYKALAQRYHPDKWQGNAEEATVRMRDINDAYRILSDPIEKAKYDKTLDKKEYQEEPDIEENIDASLEDAWKIGLVFFPKLDELYLRLRKTNYSLGNTFKLIVIESKAFNKGVEIAEQMEKEFLIKYFGNDDKIILFARLLISKGNKQGIAALNKYIRIMGESVNSQIIIDQVRQEVNFEYEGIPEVMKNYKKTRSIANAINVLTAVGYRVSMDRPDMPQSLQSFTATIAGKDKPKFHFTNASLLEFSDKLMSEYYKNNI